MIINNYDYPDDEVMEALRKKGYTLLPFVWIFEDETFPNGIEIVKSPTKCAVKAGEIPCEQNIWTNVALREFQKSYIRPPLV